MCPARQTPELSSKTTPQRMGMWALTAVGCGIMNPVSYLHATRFYPSARVPGTEEVHLTCSAASTPIQHPHCTQSLQARPFQLQIRTAEWENSYFFLGNKLHVRKLDLLFPILMILAFKKCIRQRLLELPLMLTHGNTLQALRTSLVEPLCRAVRLILYC